MNNNNKWNNNYNKYNSDREITKMWDMKTRTVPIVVGALGTISI